MRHVIVREPVYPGDAQPSAAGFSNPFDASFLELCELLRVESSPVERADAGRRPVLAKTIGALDNLILRISLDSGLMRT